MYFALYFMQNVLCVILHIKCITRFPLHKIFLHYISCFTGHVVLRRMYYALDLYKKCFMCYALCKTHYAFCIT